VDDARVPEHPGHARFVLDRMRIGRYSARPWRRQRPGLPPVAAAFPRRCRRSIACDRRSCRRRRLRGTSSEQPAI